MNSRNIFFGLILFTSSQLSAMEQRDNCTNSEATENKQLIIDANDLVDYYLKALFFARKEEEKQFAIDSINYNIKQNKLLLDLIAVYKAEQNIWLESIAKNDLDDQRDKGIKQKKVRFDLNATGLYY